MFWVTWGALGRANEPNEAAQTESDASRAALEQLEADLEDARAESEAARESLARVEALLAAISVLADDRQPIEAREIAADRLARESDVRAQAALWACALDRDPLVQQICAESAVERDSLAAMDVARRVILDRQTTADARLATIRALGERQSERAAEMLYLSGGSPLVPARIRAAAVRTLEQRYPTWLADKGGPPSVVDPLGGALFVSSSGLLGGIVFSSVGVWGELEGGAAIGAVGGAAAGLGSAGLYAGSRPLTLGQGLAYSSGVGFGLTYGAWMTTAAHGAWRFVDGPRVARSAATWRGVSTLAGAGLGAVAMGMDPSPWDVLEIDTAGYLGSAVTRGVTELVGYRKPEEMATTLLGEQSYRDYERKASQRHAAAEVGGASAGLFSGLFLSKRWDLDPEDALFGAALGGQAALLGAFVPDLIGAESEQLKGYIRLPWNAAITSGLVLGEIHHMPAARTASTLWVSAAGDALGAGIPLLAGRDDTRAVASGLVPLGALGAAGGILAHPFVAPSGGDWAMTTTVAAISLGQGVLVGAAIEDLEAWRDSSQTAGLGLTAGGLAAMSSYGLAAALEPRVDQWLLIGCAAGWGSLYGGLVPHGAGVQRPAAIYLSSAITSTAAAGGTGAAAALGLKPRDTLVPQVLASAGATVGALGVALGSPSGRDASLGAVVGASAGFGIGSAVEILADPTPPRVSIRGGRGGDVVWLPLLEARREREGAMLPIAGVRAFGW